MRPDLDDFEEMNQDAAGEPRARAMSWLVLSVAVIGFAALAFYAYQSGTHSINDGNVLVVNAEPGAVKEQPAERGGEEFPHQDKTIYDALTGDKENPKVEKLLPEPEQAVMPPQTGSETPKNKTNATTFVNNDIGSKEDEEDTITEPAAPAAKLVNSAPAPVAEAPKPAPAPAPKAAPAKATAASSGGDYKIQLGAFASEEEANGQWKKITKKHGDIVKGSPIIVKADLPNGTFYRLRADGFASAADAKAACSKLSAAGQACFPAGK